MCEDATVQQQPVETVNVHQIVTEKHCVQTHTDLSQVQLACCWHYCAFPLHGRDICIWNTCEPLLQPLELKGHHKYITALAFGNLYEPLLLCSAAHDYVIIWDVEACQKKILQGFVARGTIAGILLGKVLYLCFSPDDQTVATCADNSIYLLSCKQENVLAVLEGHLAAVTAAEFCPWQPSTLVSISEDRTFKVWDLTCYELLYQSAVLSGYPLLSLCMNSRDKQFITGSADGQLYAFVLLDGQPCRRVLHIDLHKEYQKYHCKVQRKVTLSEKPGIRGLNSSKNLKYSSSFLNNESESCAYIELPILRLYCCEHLLTSLLKHNSANAKNSCSSVWVGTINGLFSLNLGTGEIEATVQFEDHLGLSILTTGSCAIANGSSNQVLCLLSSMFGNDIALLEIHTQELAAVCLNYTNLTEGKEEILNVIARTPLLPTSPLTVDLVKKEKGHSKTVMSTMNDKPVVYHTKVKSSGYTSAPRMNLFSSKVNSSRHSNSAVQTKNNRKGFTKEYPLDSLAPNKLYKQVVVSNKPTAVCCLQYSGDGKRLACGLADKTMLVYTSSLAGSPAVFKGHDGAVSCVSWSQNNKWLLSASEDQTLWIWPAQGSKPALILGADTFLKPARSAQFYYMDKFLLFASGSEFQLHRYHLDTSRDDIKSYKKKSRSKLVGKFKMTATQEITCLSAVNDFYSYIVLTAGTNRALEVFDLNVGQSVVTVPDAHARPVHQICQNKGSAFSTQPSEAYNLFLTTAVTDGIKLWDLRTLRSVRRYEGYHNRCQPCGIAFSPCGRFLATGSEDKCAYLFELGSNNFIHKLSGHTDTVINLAFSYSAPKLTTATLDGKLQLYVP
ncbi:WD repeat-containing protein 27 [Callorhinchus milii]|nr:WD repeat-containing protein 27 [Callorhinchus milii]